MNDALPALALEIRDKLKILEKFPKTANTLQKNQIESLRRDIERLLDEMLSDSYPKKEGDERIEMLLLSLKSIVAGKSVRVILQNALVSATKLVGANYGTIILETEFRSGCKPMLCVPPCDSDDPFPYSKTVVENVLKSGNGIFKANALEDEELKARLSVVAKKIFSIIAVPIKEYGETIGVVYLDSREIGQDFKIEDLKFIENFASIVSLALESAYHNENILEVFKKEKKAEINAMIGQSKSLKKVNELIDLYAPKPQPVHIFGETGTGKRLVAEALHDRSNREGLFISVNCAGIVETLFESEIFGHRKGAFTDAYTDKKGRVEQAKNGTLFLDEVSELSLRSQAKLLQLLDNGTYSMLGDEENLRKSTARVVTATNCDLEELVKQKLFREDLFYRLKVLTINVPPLRERLDDIPHLCQYFLERECHGRRVIGLETSVVEQLMKLEWRGNIRELKNFIERLLIHAKTPSISLDFMKEMCGISNAEIDPFALLDGYTEEEIIERVRTRAIKKTANLTKAAELLGISPSTLSKWQKRGESE